MNTSAHGSGLPLDFATAGVLYLAFAHRHLPWIALTGAFTFGIYSVMKKIGMLGWLFGLMLETGILAVASLICLLYFNDIGQGALPHTGLVADILLVGKGFRCCPES